MFKFLNYIYIGLSEIEILEHRKQICMQVIKFYLLISTTILTFMLKIFNACAYYV